VNTTPNSISQQQFDELLAWLDPDRDKAGHKYESIRKRLIKMFVSRGVQVSEDLADRTFNRVIQKLPVIRDTFVGDPAHYFYSVAIHILHEFRREQYHPAVHPPPPAPPDEEHEENVECLQTCIQELPALDRDLVLTYYQEEKHAKIDNRKKLAESLGLSMTALRIRACRIRAGLKECMECRRREKSGG
jgi:RNA polymerase sigma factor (sigma-70 family)